MALHRHHGYLIWLQKVGGLSNGIADNTFFEENPIQNPLPKKVVTANVTVQITMDNFISFYLLV